MRATASPSSRHRRRVHRRRRDVACGSDIRLRRAANWPFLFVRVGLAGAAMGATALLPRLIGLSRAADLLYTGRAVGGRGGQRSGLPDNRLVEPSNCSPKRRRWRRAWPRGPTFGHAMTKTMLWQE